MDRHAIAIVAIAGSLLDVVGALYLAYDLLGGEHGPLRTLTRGVTYAVFYAVGYGLGLGPAFGIAAGAAHGVTLSWEFARASRHESAPGLWNDMLASGIRGAGFGIGLGWTHGWRFGVVLGILSTLGQVLAYRLGIRPTLDYHPQRHLHISRSQFLAAINRTVGYIATTWLAATINGHPSRPMQLALHAGTTIGVVTAAGNLCTPLVEWTADNVPEKRLAVFGLALILCGFFLQSMQYWVVVLDIPVR